MQNQRYETNSIKELRNKIKSWYKELYKNHPDGVPPEFTQMLRTTNDGYRFPDYNNAEENMYFLLKYAHFNAFEYSLMYELILKLLLKQGVKSAYTYSFGSGSRVDGLAMQYASEKLRSRKEGTFDFLEYREIDTNTWQCKFDLNGILTPKPVLGNPENLKWWEDNKQEAWLQDWPTGLQDMLDGYTGNLGDFFNRPWDWNYAGNIFFFPKVLSEYLLGKAVEAFRKRVEKKITHFKSNYIVLAASFTSNRNQMEEYQLFDNMVKSFIDRGFESIDYSGILENQLELSWLENFSIEKNNFNGTFTASNEEMSIRYIRFDDPPTSEYPDYISDFFMDQEVYNYITGYNIKSHRYPLGGPRDYPHKNLVSKRGTQVIQATQFRIVLLLKKKDRYEYDTDGFESRESF